MAKQDEVRVGILMGSDSDWPVMQGCAEMLKGFGVGFEARVCSAHRSPDEAAVYARQAAERGLKVIIAGAGMAAHLGGVLAAHTILPVIGVPLSSGVLDGMDAVLSTVQMPPGVPVATMGVGKAGAKNAAVLAVQMLALGDEDLQEKLKAHKQKLADGVRDKNAALQQELEG